LNSVYLGEPGKPEAIFLERIYTRRFFNQANGYGTQDENGVFVQIQLESTYFLCMFTTSTDFTCVKSDGEELYNYYVVPSDGDLKGLVMTLGWGYSSCPSQWSGSLATIASARVP